MIVSTLPFGETVRMLRKLMGMTQREFAAEIGLDFALWSKIENQRLPPPDDATVQRISEFTTWGLSELLWLAHQPFTPRPSIVRGDMAFVCPRGTPGSVIVEDLTGDKSLSDLVVCERCGGNGYATQEDADGRTIHHGPCERCQGTGIEP